MAKRYTDEFRRDAVRIATTSGLTRPQLSVNTLKSIFKKEEPFKQQVPCLA